MLKSFIPHILSAHILQRNEKKQPPKPSPSFPFPPGIPDPQGYLPILSPNAQLLVHASLQPRSVVALHQHLLVARPGKRGGTDGGVIDLFSELNLDSFLIIPKPKNWAFSYHRAK